MASEQELMSADPMLANKNPNIIKAAQEELGCMDVLVCGKCYSVFHFVEQFQEHKMEHICGEAVFKTNITESKPQVWAFLLWKSTVSNQKNVSKDTNLNSWHLYQTWCKMEQSVREAWITAGRAIQGFSTIANAKIQEVSNKAPPTKISDASQQKSSGKSILKSPDVRKDTTTKATTKVMQPVENVEGKGQRSSPATPAKKEDKLRDTIDAVAKGNLSSARRKQNLKVRDEFLTDSSKENVPNEDTLVSDVEIKEEKISDDEEDTSFGSQDVTPRVTRSKATESPQVSPAKSDTGKKKVPTKSPASNKVVRRGRPSKVLDDTVESEDSPDENDAHDIVNDNAEDDVEEEVEEKEYVVERILAKRYNPKKKTYEYLLKWEGYSMDQNTWEPVENMAACDKLVEAFEKSLEKLKKGDSKPPKMISTSKAPTPSTSKVAAGSTADKTITSPGMKVVAALSQKGIIPPSQKVVAALKQKGIGLSNQKAAVGTTAPQKINKRKHDSVDSATSPGGSRPVRNSKMKAMENVKLWVGSSVKKSDITGKRKAEDESGSEEEIGAPEKRMKLDMDDDDDDWHGADSDDYSDGGKATRRQSSKGESGFSSPTKSDDIVKRNRGRPRKEFYTSPDTTRKKASNDLAIKLGLESPDSSPEKKISSKKTKKSEPEVTIIGEKKVQPSRPPKIKDALAKTPAQGEPHVLVANSKGIIPVDPVQISHLSPGVFIVAKKITKPTMNAIAAKTPLTTPKTFLVASSVADANIELPQSGVIRRPVMTSNSQIALPTSGVIRRPPDLPQGGVIKRPAIPTTKSDLPQSGIIKKSDANVNILQSGVVKKTADPKVDVEKSDVTKNTSNVKVDLLQSGIVKKDVSKSNVSEKVSVDKSDVKKVQDETKLVTVAANSESVMSDITTQDTTENENGTEEITSTQIEDDASKSDAGKAVESDLSKSSTEKQSTSEDSCDLPESESAKESKTPKSKSVSFESGIVKKPGSEIKPVLKSGIIRKPSMPDLSADLLASVGPKKSAISNVKVENIQSGIVKKPVNQLQKSGSAVSPKSPVKILPKLTPLSNLPSGVVKIPPNASANKSLLAPRSSVTGINPIVPKNITRPPVNDPKTLGLPRGMSMLTARPGLSPRFGGQGSPFKIKKSPLVSSSVRPRFTDMLSGPSPGSQVKSGIKPIHAMLGKSIQQSYSGTSNKEQKLLGSKSLGLESLILAKQTDNELTLISADKEGSKFDESVKKTIGRGRGKQSLLPGNSFLVGPTTKQKASKLIEGDGLHMQFEEDDSSDSDSIDSLPELPMGDLPPLEPDSPPRPFSLCPETGKILCRAEGEKTPPPSPEKPDSPPGLTIDALEPPGESSNEAILPDKAEDLALLTGKDDDSTETILKVEMSPGGTTGTVLESAANALFGNTLHTGQATVVTKITSPDKIVGSIDGETVRMMSASDLADAVSVPGTKLFQDSGVEELMAITGEDGLLYHITSDGSIGGETVLVQGEDGEQQCLYLTSNDGVVTLDSAVAEAVAQLGSADELAGSQFVIKEGDEDGQIVMASVVNENDEDTMQAQVVAQVVHEGDSGTGVRKVVLMLPNGNLMMTEVDEEQYAALDLNK